MNKLINTLKNNNFIGLVLLGIVIQAITAYITFQVVGSQPYTPSTCYTSSLFVEQLSCYLRINSVDWLHNTFTYFMEDNS